MRFKVGDKVKVPTTLDTRGYFIGRIVTRDSVNDYGKSWIVKIIDHSAEVNIGAKISKYEANMEHAETDNRTIRELMT